MAALVSAERGRRIVLPRQVFADRLPCTLASIEVEREVVEVGRERTVATGRLHPALDRRLRSELVAWLTTVRPDGRPHIVPTWYSWDGEAFLIFSKPDAVKVRNLRARRGVMLAIGDPIADFDVQLIEGEAHLLPEPASAILPPAHLARYGRWLSSIGLDAAEYAATYSQGIRIVPTRFLPWRGRAAGGRDLTVLAAAA